jgi:hypothetical protein
MGKLKSVEELFEGHHFDRKVFVEIPEQFD